MALFQMQSIGVLHCAERYRFEAPRQSVWAGNQGYIEFESGRNYEQALEDLAGFERIWVIFCFHLNANWSVKVMPPVNPGRKIGVFATRSPHRPNRIGMSAVELVRVEGRRLYIQNFDLLDLTPVLDVKPYIPQADSFPEAKTGWLEEALLSRYEVTATAIFSEMKDFIQAAGGPDLWNFAAVQLSVNPLDKERKRLYPQADGGWEIGCRTWRIGFDCNQNGRRITLKYVRSNYDDDELKEGATDRYGDKALHRIFRMKYL